MDLVKMDIKPEDLKPVGSNVAVDKNNMPIYEDQVTLAVSLKEVKFMFDSCCLLFHEEVKSPLVPHDSVDACFDVITYLAELHEDARAKGMDIGFDIVLPVNYFKGLWHMLNTARMYKLWERDKSDKKAESLDRITKKVASRLDAYVAIKTKENLEDGKEVKTESPKMEIKIPKLISTNPDNTQGI